MAASRTPLLSVSAAIYRQSTVFFSKQPGADCDLWSRPKEAELYAKYRPEYQETVIPWLVDYYRRRHPNEAGSNCKIPLAIDVHCGGGQLTGVLASYCDRVIGIDISEAQLNMAKRYNGHANVDYWRASHTELVTLCAGLKADVITIGMGIPTFNCKEFYDAVAQCLRPRGVFGAFGYYMRGDLEGQPELGCLLGNCLEKNLTSLSNSFSLLKNHYRDINPPFDDQERREARVKYPTTNERMVGIIQSHVKDFKNGEEAVNRFREALPALVNANMYIDVFGIMAQLD